MSKRKRIQLHTLKHELNEAADIKMGWDYWPAHLDSLKRERTDNIKLPNPNFTLPVFVTNNELPRCPKGHHLTKLRHDHGKYDIYFCPSCKKSYYGYKL